MAIQDSLISWWSLDEESGERADSHGANPLTDNNTVLFAVGKVKNAADFEVDNEEYLSHADNASLSFGDEDFTIAYWVKHETLGGVTQRHVAKWVAAGNHREYIVSYRGPSDRFAFFLSDDGTNEGITNADELGAPSTGTWYFIVAWHDATANTRNIQVNNGAIDSDAHSTGVNDDTSLFAVGALSSDSQWMDGLIDEACMWRRVLTADEKTWLYNGGAGRGYGDWVGGDQVIWMM